MKLKLFDKEIAIKILIEEWKDLFSNFPGLENDEEDVHGGDLIEYLSINRFRVRAALNKLEEE